MNAITEIFAIVVPVFFVLLIGYISGRAKKFDLDQVQGIYELVPDFAPQHPVCWNGYYKPLLAL